MIALILAAATAFATAFSGSWICHSQNALVPWEIAAAPGGAWTTVRWSDQTNDNGGIAYVGYQPKLGRWVYRDFHYDGSYADITGTQVGNQWRWTGPFYAGSRQFDGDILWTLTTPDRIDRVFRSVIKGKLTQTGSDYCVRAAAHS